MARRLRLRIKIGSSTKLISFEKAVHNDELAEISYWDNIEKYEKDFLRLDS